MMALFSPNTDLVGWLNDGGFIFDLNLAAVAFVRGEHAFAYPSCSWLGSVEATTLMDRSGKPVAFNPDLAPRGRLPP